MQTIKNKLLDSDLMSIAVDGEAFALPVISNLLLKGPGQRQIYKLRASAFRGCPNSECYLYAHIIGVFSVLYQLGM